MTTTKFLHRSDTRKFEDFGFMTEHLSFKPDLSEDRRRFGPLITIDDGVLEPGATGFGYHPHKDVEVVTFMVDGEVNHLDPNEKNHNETLAAKGIQIITAGTGIIHNEVNHSATTPMRALQIWFEPRAKGLTPDYAKRHLNAADYTNKLQLILSPDGANGSLIVQQDARLSYGLFDLDTILEFRPHEVANGVYVFMVDGTAEVAGETLVKGDAIGLVAPGKFPVAATAGAEILIFDLADTSHN
jgi:quercetin 2,3-dioxygenase